MRLQDAASQFTAYLAGKAANRLWPLPMKESLTMDDNLFGDVIYSYTRAQAIEDGVLVDVSALARARR
jgi:type I site-specific restriction endonuclease